MVSDRSPRRTTATFDTEIELVESDRIQRVASPAVTELAYCAAFGTENEQRKVRNALGTYSIVERDDRIAHRAGRLLAAAGVAADGESGVDGVELVIAAVADRYDEPVLTANRDDFRTLGVDVETY